MHVTLWCVVSIPLVLGIKRKGWEITGDVESIHITARLCPALVPS
jgi:hypothetical protein